MPQEILLRVVVEGEEGIKPYHGGNAVIPHGSEHVKTRFGRTDAGFQNTAERFVVRGQGHLYHAFGFAMDSGQQFQIPQDEIWISVRTERPNP